MRSFADYSIPNGDRETLDLDDEDLAVSEPVEIEESKSVLPETKGSRNLVVKVISNNQQQGKRIKVNPIPIPRAFDLDYYQDKINNAKFNNDRDGEIKAYAIKRYADIVYEFYKNITYVFNKKNNILDMPEYIKLSEKVPCDLNRLAEVLVEREKALISAFNGSDNVIKAFDKRKRLTELKIFASQAWIMYYNLKSLNDFIGYLRFIQNCNNKADFTNKSHIANLYGLHVQVGYYIDANIKNFFSVNNKGLLFIKNPATAWIYSDLNSIEQFNILLKEKDAYVYSDNHEKILSLANSIQDDTIEKRIVGFYNHYRDMKYVKHTLKHIYTNHKDEDVSNIFMFEDVNNPNLKFINRDVFKVGLRYYNACKSLVESLPVKSKIYRDICDMCAELEETLSDNLNKYKVCAEENKKIDEQILKERPEWANKFNTKQQKEDTFIKND